MTARPLFHFFLFRLLPALVLGLASIGAPAQADPPGRVARLNHAQGAVVFSPAGDNEWTEAESNRPLTRGDRLWTDRGSRAEIQVGSSAVRMDGQTHLELLTLDDRSAQLSVTQGVVYVRVRSLPENENFEIDTPNVAYRAVYPGDYRIDVDAASGTTRVTIHSGTGAVYGEDGQALPLGGGQQITFRARSLVQVNAQESPPQDGFDRWAGERNRQEDQSISARYVPREVVGYQQLDAHGLWTPDATHGMVWYPHGIAAGWAPYRQGRWEWIPPWGWTWIDDAPWGFAPFHYGRWAMIDSRWAWVPGRLGLHPVYAPALVAFIGERSGSGWGFSIGAGRPGVAWFPLAPGEAWQPGYRASPVYISNVNRNIAVQPKSDYAYQRTGEALSVISAEDFHRGRPTRGGWLRVAANALTNAQIVPPPAMPEPSGVIARQRAAPSQVAPPASAEIRPVIAKSPPAPVPGVQSAQRVASAAPGAPAAVARAADVSPQPKHERPARREQLASRAEQAGPEQPAPSAEQVKREKIAPHTAQPKGQRALSRAEQSKAERIARRDDQAKREQVAQQAKREQVAQQAKREQVAQQAKREQVAQQAKREQVAKRTEQAKREQMAHQARREQVAKRTEQIKREQVAMRMEQVKRAAQIRAEQHTRHEQSKREQLARRDEQARREQQARKADQARREAQAQRDEQARREAHAQRVEQARRAADRDAQVLQEQRVAREERARRAEREEQARREAQEREQREASLRQQQQALSEQARRDRLQWERQQRERGRRPDLREDRREPPEIWQRSIPLWAPGRTS